MLLAILLCARSGAFHPAIRPRPAIAREAITHKDIAWTPTEKNGDRAAAYGPLEEYCESLAAVRRRATRTVTAGPVKFGSEHPIVRQTMATTTTGDVEGTIEQVIRCADAGFDMVRITVVGMKEATACGKIREGLDARGYDIPLCADMHFQPKVAMKTAEAIEKIRINPGNFADGRKVLEEKTYDTDEEFYEEREYITEAFAPLVLKCKDLNRAMRIGTNHGSLSSRILSFYGDSPRGMVESAIEFADICRSLDYHNFVFSMKASNPVVMIQAYRLLAAEQYRLGWDYPIHLGVTEAGEGEDGRMKSAIGIGTLLADGLGDTIRVSLTEDPEFEYPPCNRLAELGVMQLEGDARDAQAAVPEFKDTRDITVFNRRRGPLPEQRDGDALDYRGLLHRDGSVLSALTTTELSTLGSMGELGESALYRALGAKETPAAEGGSLPMKDVATTDALLLRDPPAADDTAARSVLNKLARAGVHAIVPAAALSATPLPGAVPLVELSNLEASLAAPPVGDSGRLAVTMRGDEPESLLAAMVAAADQVDMVILEAPAGLSRLHATRRLFSYLDDNAPEALSVVHHLRCPQSENDELALQLGMQAGALLGDGLGDGILLEPEDGAAFDIGYLRETSFALLQGSRMRNTKTEFVSCPSCGRTLFDLQEVTAQISERTGHLPGVTVAIMGCIVNGPGEMADADFGYVGGAPGKVDLYVGKEVVKRAIPNEVACDALIDLIKENGMWAEKEEDDLLQGLVAA